jgi:hypothetical protein
MTEKLSLSLIRTKLNRPPVCLSRFSDDRYAANVTEFINITAGAIRRIAIGAQ